MKLFIRKNKLEFLPTQTDVFIIEYPKSGITWFSHILASAIAHNNNINMEINQVSQRFYVQDLHVYKSRMSKFYDTPINSFYKSHVYDKKYMKNIIYLVRHPADVMTSYYNYLKLHRQYNGSIDDFLKKENYLNAWKSHVGSVLKSNIIGSPRFIIKYEDLKQRTYEKFNELNILFGWNFAEETINYAIENSSLIKMKKFDKLYREKLIAKNKIEFVNSEKPKLSKDQLSYILTATTEERRILKYV